MGVERAVTRWYVQRQLLHAEIEMLSAKLSPGLTNLTNSSEDEPVEAAPLETSNPDEVAQQLARTQEKLHLLGPCPKPMMG